MFGKNSEIVVLGAGLAGLAAGSVLSRAGARIKVIEGGPVVGGLARTMDHRGFKFDLGGHRFITKSDRIERFLLDLLGSDLLTVPRKSSIYMRGKYFDYPLKPANALFGLGVHTTLRILADYCSQRAKNAFRQPAIVSLEDWVVHSFGRRMFDLYFQEYSEKVWGIPCGNISMEWVAKRIEGLSLGKAIKNAFSKRSGRDIHTLADRFLYPPAGIGLISDRLKQEIERENTILTGTRVIRLRHEDFTVTSAMVRSGDTLADIEGGDYVSSIPLTNFVKMLHPAPPDDVREAADRLRYRDLVVVTVMLDRERVTDLTWMYLPEKHIPFGRVHEPKNWSPFMAPEGKTHLVAEYFCFRGDEVWRSSDEGLAALTVKHLFNMGFIEEREVIDSCVIRVPNAYPILDVGYSEHHDRIMAYLKQFRNLRVVGRGGTFQYLNMDHAIASGIEAAEAILRKAPADIDTPGHFQQPEPALAESARR